MEHFLGLNELFDYSLYLRGIIITLFAIILFRVNLARLYGNHSALDFIIFIILGAILGEAIINNVPLLSSMIVCTLIVIIYRALTYMTYKSHWFGKYIKGNKVVIVRNGKYVYKNLKSCHITSNDILQTLRIDHSLKNINAVKEATLERGGQISFILKRRSGNQVKT